MHITHRWAAFTRMKFALLVLALGLAGPASVGAQVKGDWHPSPQWSRCLPTFATPSGWTVSP